MKRLATATAAIALIGTPAFAADVALKAPPSPPPAPIYNWTGWYAGVNAGASFGTTKTDFNVSPVAATLSTFFGGKNVVTPNFGFSDAVYPAAFVGGGQVGYNWLVSPLLVAGLEADFQGSTERETSNLSNAFSVLSTGASPPITVTGGSVTNYTTNIDWFGTVRGRVGYLWGNGEVMSYVTGGLAYGDVKIHGTNTVSGVSGTPVFSVTQTFDHSHVNTGWVVGTGTEGKLLIPGWTYKIEALYMDLGHLDATGVTSSVFTGPGVTGPTGGQITSHTHFTDTILRVGLNYQFH